MDNWKPWIDEIKNNKFYAVGLLVLLTLPVTLILVFRSQDTRTSAALPDALEAESGVTSSTGVTKQSDSSASGGQYIKFAKSTSGPTPTPPPNTNNIGPRPDPVFPTGTNVVVVDSSVPTNGTDAKPALQAFIDKQPNGTTIIFDKTKGGTGTTYNLNSRINLITKKDITLWGYNSKLKLTREDGSTEGAGILVRNGSENIKILGFEIEGPNYTNDLHDLYDVLPGEWSHGIYIMISRNVTIQDNHIHHVNGDAVYGLARGPSSTSWNDGGKGWTYQGPFEISYNYFHHTGRQGIANMSGNLLNIHHNLFEDIVAWPVDLEDHGEEPFVFDELYITDNIMRRFNWWVRYNCHSTSILYSPSKKFDWSRNLIDEGCMGIGNADVPISVYEKYGTTNLYPRPGHRWIQVRTRHPSLTHTNEVIIQNNRVTVGANNLQGTRTDEGALALENSSNILTISGNQFEPQARIILVGDTNIENISNNGDARVQYEWYP
jgi:hypothetical protein